MRKQCNRTPRPARVPVMATTWRSVATAMHTALALMRTSPAVEAFDTLAGILSSISVALADDDKRKDEAATVASSLEALQATENAVLVGAPLRPEELAAITRGVNTVDRILPRLGFEKLQAAEAVAVAQRRAMRSQRMRTYGRA